MNYSTVSDGEVTSTHTLSYLNIPWVCISCLSCPYTHTVLLGYLCFFTPILFCLSKVEQNWATLQGGEMTIQTTQSSEATQAVASLAVAASQEMQPGTTVTMALNRYSWEVAVRSQKQRKEILNRRINLLGAGLCPQGLVTWACSPVYHKRVTAAAAQKYNTAGTIGSYSFPLQLGWRGIVFCSAAFIKAVNPPSVCWA